MYKPKGAHHGASGLLFMNAQSVKVLLVEDNAEHVEFLRRLLAQAQGASDFELVPVSSLGEGIERIKENDIGLILLDLSLGDSDGLETFVRMTEAAPDIAIVVLSGINDVELAIETVQLGAQDYLVKGHVDNHLLVRSMQYALERKRVQMQLRQAHDQLERRVQERTAMLAAGRTCGCSRQIAEQQRAEEATLESNRQLADRARASSRPRSSRSSSASACTRSGAWPMASRTISTTRSRRSSALASCCCMKPEMLTDPGEGADYVEMIHAAAKDSAKVVSRLAGILPLPR